MREAAGQTYTRMANLKGGLLILRRLSLYVE